MPRRLWQMNTHTHNWRNLLRLRYGAGHKPHKRFVNRLLLLLSLLQYDVSKEEKKKYKKMNPAGGPPQLASLCCCNHLFLVSFLFRGEMQFDFPLGWLVSHSEARGRITEADRIKSTLQSKASNNTHTRSVRGLTHPAHPSTLASTVFKIEKIKV